MAMNEVEYWQYYTAVRDDLIKAAYCYYAAKAIHTSAAESQDNLQRLNAQATFWKSTLHGMQVAWFMAVARLFDAGSDTHTLDKFLNHTVAHPEFFSREAFDARRMKDAQGVRPKYLDDYVAKIWVPTTVDLRKIRRMVRPYKEKWHKDYGPIRDRILRTASSSISRAFPPCFRRRSSATSKTSFRASTMSWRLSIGFGSTGVTPMAQSQPAIHRGNCARGAGATSATRLGALRAPVGGSI